VLWGGGRVFLRGVFGDWVSVSSRLGGRLVGVFLSRVFLGVFVWGGVVGVGGVLGFLGWGVVAGGGGGFLGGFVFGFFFFGFLGFWGGVPADL